MSSQRFRKNQQLLNYLTTGNESESKNEFEDDNFLTMDSAEASNLQTNQSVNEYNIEERRVILFEDDSDSDVESVSESSEDSDRNLVMDEDHFYERVDKTVKNGIVWSVLEENGPCIYRNRIKFTAETGPTTYASRQVDSTALSAFKCILDDAMIRYLH